MIYMLLLWFKAGFLHTMYLFLLMYSHSRFLSTLSITTSTYFSALIAPLMYLHQKISCILALKLINHFPPRILRYSSQCILYFLLLWSNSIQGNFFNATHWVKAIILRFFKNNPLPKIGDCSFPLLHSTPILTTLFSTLSKFEIWKRLPYPHLHRSAILNVEINIK